MLACEQALYSSLTREILGLTRNLLYPLAARTQNKSPARP